jgi:fatty-acyl-CoA synthase/long-chain acyl-CoA synthetase
MNVGDLLTFFTKRHADKTALIFLDQTMTYRDLNHRVNKIGNKLLSLGFRPGDKVSLLMQNCSEYIEIIFALAKIGAIPVPINFRLVGEEIAYIVNDSDSRGMVLGREFVQTIAPISHRLKVETGKFFVIGEEAQGGMTSYESLMEDSSAEEPPVAVDGKSCFVMCYTSGTTGRPKGVLSSHQSKIMESLAQALEFNIHEDDVHLAAAPLCHSAGLFLAIERLFIGGILCIMRQFDPEEVLKLTVEQKVTNTFMVPTMLNFILELPEDVKAKYEPRSMRVITCAGAPLPTRIKEGVIRFFSNAGLYEYYASTESSVATVLKPVDQLRKVRCAGKPFWGVDITLLDEENRHVSTHEVGEIYIRSPYIMDGYYKKGREGFHEGWLASGDLARQDEEGYVYIVDRAKDMIISGGENIYPTEIEDVLYSHPHVLEAAVIGIPDDRWGESVKAMIVLHEGRSLSQEEIIDYCRDKLAGYKIPRSVSFLRELPKNTSGKILRRVLREEYWKDREVKI